MANADDSTVAAPPGANGSNEQCGSPPSAGEQSLAAEMRLLVRELAETNLHLLVLTDQTAKCLAHIAVLLDLLLSDEADDSDRDATTYLDGTRIS
jgi:hypothetical protein